MKRLYALVLCSIFCLSAPAAIAAEIELQGPLFMPVAYITDRGKIMDKNHILIGRIDTEGIVYDVENRHQGFVEKDLTVRDVHYKTVATIDTTGVVSNGEGVVIGTVSETKISDARGQALIRYELPQDKRAILAYFVFFSGGFPN